MVTALKYAAILEQLKTAKVCCETVVKVWVYTALSFYLWIVTRFPQKKSNIKPIVKLPKP